MKRKWILPVILLFPALCSGRVYGAGQELVAGTTTPLGGSFFTDRWGNNSADLEVRNLIWGYPLVMWNMEKGAYEADPSVVSGMIVTENSAGDRKYRLALYEDMKYSDGTAITAADYAFSILLEASPAMKALSGTEGRASCILGGADYQSGKTDVLKGVRIPGKYELEITLDHNALPYFYELDLIRYCPYPISALSAGAQVEDTGEGVRIRGDFSAETLGEALFSEEDGFMEHPSVCSGPYVLDSFDGTRAAFSVNPHYKGNSGGAKPSIPSVVLENADNSTMMGMLSEGELDLVLRTSDANALEEGLALAMDSDHFGRTAYPRSGLAFISFQTADGPLADEKVRHAVAYCLDRDALTKAYTGSLGTPVYGWYGMGQWMVRESLSESRDALDGLERFSSGNREEDIAKAGELLTEAGWDGGELSLTLHYPEGSRIGDLLEEYLAAPFAEAGGALAIEGVPMEELLDEYYGKSEGADMVFLASNFGLAFDAAAAFREGTDGKMSFGGHGIHDEELYRDAVALGKTKPGENKEYLERWMVFQQRFARVLPALPVYSNIYMDFYTDELRGYEPDRHASLADALTASWLNSDASDN